MQAVDIAGADVLALAHARVELLQHARAQSRRRRRARQRDDVAVGLRLDRRAAPRSAPDGRRIRRADRSRCRLSSKGRPRRPGSSELLAQACRRGPRTPVSSRRSSARRCGRICMLYPAPTPAARHQAVGCSGRLAHRRDYWAGAAISTSTMRPSSANSAIGVNRLQVGRTADELARMAPLSLEQHRHDLADAAPN